MKLKNKIVLFAIVSMAFFELTYNNGRFNILLLDNIEALTDSYENKTDSNGSTLTVNNMGKPLTKEEKDAMGGELEGIVKGNNPYHYMHTDSDSMLKETFKNLTKNKNEEISKCTSKKSLCKSGSVGVCWSVEYPFFGS